MHKTYEIDHLDRHFSIKRQNLILNHLVHLLHCKLGFLSGYGGEVATAGRGGDD